jgi:hypothetical protein
MYPTINKYKKVTVTSGSLGPAVTPALAQGKTECGHPCIWSIGTLSSNDLKAAMNGRDKNQAYIELNNRQYLDWLLTIELD